MTIDDLTIRWKTLRATNGESVHQEYDTTHPVRIFFGMDNMGNCDLMVKINTRPNRLPAPSQSVRVQIISDNDGQLYLCFQLLQPEQKAVFIHLCWDIAEVSRDCSNIITAVNKMLSRYSRWQRLMERGYSGMLSAPEIKGLLGELLFLEKLLLSRQYHTVVSGWMGPEGADRDFSFQDCWYEIKSLDPSASLVNISSIEQLDTNIQGELVVIFMESAAPVEPGAVTLHSQVSRLRKILKNDFGAELSFEEKLISAGYIDRIEYESIYFVPRDKRRFRVDNSFPALRRSSLNSCIAKAQYHLSISGLINWEITTGVDVDGC